MNSSYSRHRASRLMGCKNPQNFHHTTACFEVASGPLSPAGNKRFLRVLVLLVVVVANSIRERGVERS